MEFFDSHAHYNDEWFNDDIEEIIKLTYEDGITKFLCAGYGIESSKKSIEIANKYDFIYSICGISPNDVPKKIEDVDKCVDEIEKIIIEDQQNNKKIVAIGEIGLDFYRTKENKEIQYKIFIKQIELANKYDLPIVIHTREAVDDTLKILREHVPLKKGIIHCCSFNRELVRQVLELGYYTSFAGPVTYKSSKNAEEIIKMIPMDRLLIETDSPYLAPEPKRGTRNDSRNVKLIAAKIAEFKETSIEEIAKISYENAMRIFSI